MKLAALAVLVSVSNGRLTGVVTLPVLPPAQVTGAPAQSGSVTPAGGITVAVLVMLAAAALLTVHTMLRLALPPDAMATPVHVPVPVAPDAMVPTLKVPADGVKLHAVRPAGKDSRIEKVSETAMPLGPALLMLSV